MAPNPPVPSDVRLRRKSRVLELSYADGTQFSLSFEYLRVYSPSAEVRGHGGGEGYLQTEKRDVLITGMEPVGNYALKLDFDDGHDTGIFSWQYLYELGRDQEKYWRRYLQRLDEEGGSRGSAPDPVGTWSPPGGAH